MYCEVISYGRIRRRATFDEEVENAFTIVMNRDKNWIQPEVSGLKIRSRVNQHFDNLYVAFVYCQEQRKY